MHRLRYHAARVRTHTSTTPEDKHNDDGRNKTAQKQYKHPNKQAHEYDTRKKLHIETLHGGVSGGRAVVFVAVPPPDPGGTHVSLPVLPLHPTWILFFIKKQIRKKK